MVVHIRNEGIFMKSNIIRSSWTPVSYNCLKQNKCSKCRKGIKHDKDCDDHPHKKRDFDNIVCKEICGNLLLNDAVPILEIWKEGLGESVSLTISVFNSSSSTASIQVIVFRNGDNPIEFTVPPGNTLSATVNEATSITVIRVGVGETVGEYCLEVCFPFVSEGKHKNKKHKCNTCKQDDDYF